jgi:type II secretory pathway component PulM
MSELQARWSSVKEWWSHLAVREQQAVAIGGSLVTLFILYQLIWSPWLNHIDQMRKRILSAQKTLVWMRSADVAIKNIEKDSTQKSTSATPVELLSYLQEQINQSSLAPALKELKQSENDAVEIHFQKVSFDGLVKMLTKVVKEQPVYIAQMTATADNAPGIVNADVMLKVS